MVTYGIVITTVYRGRQRHNLDSTQLYFGWEIENLKSLFLNSTLSNVHFQREKGNLM